MSKFRITIRKSEGWTGVIEAADIEAAKEKAKRILDNQGEQAFQEDDAYNEQHAEPKVHDVGATDDLVDVIEETP